MTFLREGRFVKVLLVIFFLLLIGYAYYEARAVVYGPQIHIPSETIMVTEAYTEIRGQAAYISELKLNGAMINVTEDGYFAEEMLLTPGENRLVFDAKDKFGRETQEIVKVYYRPTNDSSPPAAPEASASISEETITE